MFDAEQMVDPAPDAARLAPAPEFDLCVIGAGIAGLNALYSSVEHLRPGARVLIVDQRDGPGGMWTNTYPYVRLHQPHPSFTVGNIGWDWSKPRGYLATGSEVCAHLKRCFEQLKERVQTEIRFGHSVTALEEHAGGVTVSITGPAGELTQARANRVIDARGFQIPEPEPLTLKSRKVTSSSPLTLDPKSEAPAYIIGGGKTAMDTALMLIRANPGRQITMFNGVGTVFTNRDISLPSGLARFWKGDPVLTTFRKVAMHFDGTNAIDTFEWYRDHYTLGPPGRQEQYLFGLISEAEMAAIRDGVTRFVNAYLEDVVDTESGPEALTRDGGRHVLPEGSEIINCSGLVLRQERSYTPFLSPGDQILTITPRSATHFLTSVGGYFLPHLFLQGRLRRAGLYELDLDRFRRQADRREVHIAAVAHTFLNTLKLFNLMPFSVMDRCHLDFDRWFPMHRRIAILVDMKLNQARYIAHCEKVLAQVRERHGIACGPLPLSQD